MTLTSRGICSTSRGKYPGWRCHCGLITGLLRGVRGLVKWLERQLYQQISGFWREITENAYLNEINHHASYLNIM